MRFLSIIVNVCLTLSESAELLPKMTVSFCVVDLQPSWHEVLSVFVLFYNLILVILKGRWSYLTVIFICIFLLCFDFVLQHADYFGCFKSHKYIDILSG